MQRQQDSQFSQCFPGARSIVRFVLGLTVLSGELRAATLPATDKVAHFSTSAVLSSGFTKVGQAVDPEHRVTWNNRLVAAGAALALGLAKELSDQSKKGGNLDWGDLGADTGGVILGQLLQWEF